MLVVGDHDFKIPSRHTQGRICHWSQSTDYHQDRTSANRLGAPTPLKRSSRRKRKYQLGQPSRSLAEGDTPERAADLRHAVLLMLIV
ncbi:unnamed protein product [Caenorhabditis auriculariae]|uniref:Uncharacterized protein n=1 Tax=Caenorhabditis auriculariae TaxID=2777116 RepID=A0A8S1HHM5_9PELO|nr:unnamed protein product [Caenorhabditis auriculariae]